MTLEYPTNGMLLGLIGQGHKVTKCKKAYKRRSSGWDELCTPLSALARVVFKLVLVYSYNIHLSKRLTKRSESTEMRA